MIRIYFSEWVSTLLLCLFLPFFTWSSFSSGSLSGRILSHGKTLSRLSKGPEKNTVDIGIRICVTVYNALTDGMFGLINLLVNQSQFCKF